MILLLAARLSGDVPDDKRIYISGKEYCSAGLWERAIASFDTLIGEYPESGFRDAAYFWKAFCLEKSRKPERAFETFQRLVNEYPESTWRDDAVIKQILLASQLVSEGRDQYLHFLRNTATAESGRLRYQAGLALAKLGLKEAIPVLEGFRSTGLFSEEAAVVLEQLRVQHDRSTVLAGMMSGREFFPGRKTDFSEKRFLSSKRDYLRAQMLKKGAWSWMELVGFALLQTIPEEQFVSFWECDSDTERQNWLDDFWKVNDPDSLSSGNTFKDEFLRRVKYARTNFSELYDPERHGEMERTFEKKKYMLKGEPNEPWDARGEVYMKFGEPDLRREELIKKRRHELWVYYAQGIDFVISVFKTNVYRDAIAPGEMAASNYQFNVIPWEDRRVLAVPWSQASPGYSFRSERPTDTEARKEKFIHDYIEQPAFFYNPDPDRTLKLDKIIVSEEHGGKGKFSIGLQIKPEAYNLITYDGPFYACLTNSYRVIADDGRIVARGEKKNYEVALPGRNDLIREVIPLSLQPGEYTFECTIVDHNAKKEAVIRRALTIDPENKILLEAAPEHASESGVQPEQFFAGRDREYRHKSFWTTKRTYQYNDMLKTGDWSEMELIAFGLWEVIPPKEFSEFWGQQTNGDRKVWLEKFWKRNDPAPGTPGNEFRDEFMHRIQYAREHFSELYDPAVHGEMQRTFEKKAVRLKGDRVAPWDARGDLYVINGAPAARMADSLSAQRYEVWTYRDDMINIFPDITGQGRTFFNVYDPAGARGIVQYRVRHFITNYYGSGYEYYPPVIGRYNGQSSGVRGREPHPVEPPRFWITINSIEQQYP